NLENAVGSPPADGSTGDAGPNTLVRLAGNDSISGGDGKDNLFPGTGTDTLDGGADSRDTVIYTDITGFGVTVDLTAGTASGGGGQVSDTISGVEFATGSQQDDSLTGTSGLNVLIGLAGNDTINGLAGNDSIFPGPGTNHSDGGADTDVVTYSNVPTAITGTGV